MAKKMRDFIKALPKERQEKINKRAKELIDEVETLRALREAHHLTQVAMAKELGVGQDSISRLEKRSDLMLSTLRKYINGMGGELNLVVQFPDTPPVLLSGFRDETGTRAE